MKATIAITTNISPELASHLLLDGGRKRMLEWIIEVCARDVPGTSIKLNTSRTVELGEPTLFDDDDEAEPVTLEQAAA